MSSFVTCPVCSASVHESMINYHLDSGCPAPSTSTSTSKSSTERPSGAKKPTTQEHTSAAIVEIPDDSPVKPQPLTSSSDFSAKPKAVAALFLGSTSAKRKRSTEETPKKAEERRGGQDPFEDGGREARIGESTLVEKKPRLDHLKAAQPLAERSRPTSLASFIGQLDILGPHSLLRSSLEAGTSHRIGSCILWGPPGSGKTTLARLIARQEEADFRELSATSAGTADVRKVFEQAKNQLKLLGRKTVMFIDEIHRFTKPQQDLFLPFVENGWVQLIGATTENPSFKVNGALLSRCQVFTLSKLTPSELEQILQNALSSLAPPLPRLPTNLIPFLANVADGDARQALNSLELSLSVCERRDKERAKLTAFGDVEEENGDTDRAATMNGDTKNEAVEDRELMDAIKRGLRKGYDRTGEERYDMISALHKSIRGSDGSAALYWLARMLTGGEDPLYIARRLIVVASEDVGMSTPHGLPLAMATYQACQVIGMPECRINLAHCVTFLSEAKKSTRSYEAYNRAEELAHETPLPPVPLGIRNAPTALMKKLGYGRGYAYDPGFQHPVYNEFMPMELLDQSTYGPESLLKSEALYEKKADKQWDEIELEDWEFKRNGSKDWEGRVTRG